MVKARLLGSSSKDDFIMVPHPCIPFSSYRSCKNESKNTNQVKTTGSLAAAVWNPSPSSWLFGNGAALVVHHGLFEVVGGLRRVQPSVYHDSEHNIICIFQGYLSNLDELIERYCDLGTIGAASPTAVIRSAGKDGREAAAEVVCKMYQRNDSPLILLSELQGQYAFTLYDAEGKQAFVARDSSGRENVFYEISDDGNVSVSNRKLNVSSSDISVGGQVQWSLLPPGHFISGKTPKLQQFALTPKQLSLREYYESMDDELSPQGSSRRSLSDEFAEEVAIID